jgi:hypothetical protein
MRSKAVCGSHATLSEVGKVVINKQAHPVYRFSECADDRVALHEGSVTQFIPVESARQLRGRTFPVTDDTQMTLEHHIGRAPIALGSEDAKMAAGAGAIRTLLARLHVIGVLEARLSTN